MQPVLYPVAIARLMEAIIATQAPRFGHRRPTLQPCPCKHDYKMWTAPTGWMLRPQSGANWPDYRFVTRGSALCMAATDFISWNVSDRKCIMETQSQPSATIDG